MKHLGIVLLILLVVAGGMVFPGKLGWRLCGWGDDFGILQGALLSERDAPLGKERSTLPLDHLRHGVDSGL